MPTPRNDSAVSASSAKATPIDTCTMTGASTFGSTWRPSTRPWLAPAARALSTNGSSRSESTCPRTRRAKRGV